MKYTSEIESLIAARSEDDLYGAIALLCQELGFIWAGGFAATHTGCGTWTFQRYGTYPSIPLCYDLAAARCDPVSQYVKYSASPLIWGRSTYEFAGQAEQWEAQLPYGLSNGVAAALHLPGGRALAFGLDRMDPIDPNPQFRSNLVQRFQTCHAFLEDAFSRIVGWSESKDRCSFRPLTARELECLKWAAEGKTMWETGQLLHISERTVKMHVDSAVATLQCVSKTHAVARAIRLRLI